MKRSLHLMIALLFAFVGMVNAQTVNVGFDNGDFGQLYDYDLQNDSEYPWYVEYSEYGDYCMRSGNAGVTNSSSSISITVPFADDGYIEFTANCMGEGEAFDVCQFLIDGVVQFSYGQNVSGWEWYGYYVAAGSHQFTWRYFKDGSVDPEGDCFQVDNIWLEGVDLGCVAPTWIEAVGSTDFVYADWDGYSDSYTLRYQKGSGSWTVVEGITSRYYVIEDLVPGYYTLEVIADCDPETVVSTTCMVYQPYSWSDWYGFSNYSYDEYYYRRFIQFKLDDISNVAAASDSYDDGGEGVYSTIFVKGDVWFVRYDYYYDAYNLYKAPVDMWEKTIGTAELVKSNFGWVRSMSFNAANGWIYYVDDSGYLKKFKPENVNKVESCGEIGEVAAFAVNRKGQAFACAYDDTTDERALYAVNLTNASKTRVGAMEYYVSSFAFDMLTGELFAIDYDRMYYVNTSDAYMTYLGVIGGYDYCELGGFFMTYPYNAVEEHEAENVTVYPNPAQGCFTVEGTGTLTITNLLGQDILVQEVDGKATLELPVGIYIVRLGNNIQKLVVE